MEASAFSTEGYGGIFNMRTVVVVGTVSASVYFVDHRRAVNQKIAGVNGVVGAVVFSPVQLIVGGGDKRLEGGIAIVSADKVAIGGINVALVGSETFDATRAVVASKDSTLDMCVASDVEVAQTVDG